MSSFTWKGVSGDWNLASDWTPAGGPPKSTNSATIDGTAATTITVDTADVAKSLTLSDANATLNDDGGASLTIGGTLTMSNGTLDLSPYGPDGGAGVLTVGALNLSGGALTINSGGQLNLNGTLSQTGGTLTLQGGTISGGTIKSTAGTLTLSSGTLSGVTYDGTLDLSGANTNVDIANGTVVNNAAGTGAGTINDTGQSSFLFFDNTQTFNNATINLGNATGYSSFLYEFDTTGAGTVLTLGSKVTVDESGYAQIRDSGSAGDGIVNQGTISQTASGADSPKLRQFLHQQRHDHGGLERRLARDRHHHLHQQRRDRYFQRRDRDDRADQFQQRLQGRDLGWRRFDAESGRRAGHGAIWARSRSPAVLRSIWAAASRSQARER